MYKFIYNSFNYSKDGILYSLNQNEYRKISESREYYEYFFYLIEH